MHKCKLPRPTGRDGIRHTCSYGKCRQSWVLRNGRWVRQ